MKNFAALGSLMELSSFAEVVGTTKKYNSPPIHQDYIVPKPKHGGKNYSEIEIDDDDFKSSYAPSSIKSTDPEEYIAYRSWPPSTEVSLDAEEAIQDASVIDNYFGSSDILSTASAHFSEPQAPSRRMLPPASPSILNYRAQVHFNMEESDIESDEESGEGPAPEEEDLVEGDYPESEDEIPYATQSVRETTLPSDRIDPDDSAKTRADILGQVGKKMTQMTLENTSNGIQCKTGSREEEKRRLVALFSCVPMTVINDDKVRKTGENCSKMMLEELANQEILQKR
jgi:hypothetical protein